MNDPFLGRGDSLADREERNLYYMRAAIAAVLIVLAAILRILPHPWNFTPVGAMAIFSGSVLRNRSAALLLPLTALFAGDAFVGFHKLMLAVYGSFAVSVALGRWLAGSRTVARILGAVLLGAAQFYLLTNLAAWAFLNFYPKTGEGLWACYVAGLPLVWNTLAGDVVYAAVLFGGYVLAERMLPETREARQGEKQS
jgi:hypothetical protein